MAHGIPHASCAGNNRPRKSLPATPVALMELMRSVVELSRDAVCIIDCEDSTVEDVNEAAMDLLGYPDCEWSTLTLPDLIPTIRDLAEVPEKTFVEAHVRHQDGHSVPVRWCTVGSDSDPYFAVVFRAIDSTKPVSEADRDPLTGLANRTIFECRLKDAMERGDDSFALLFLDLDDFKVVNDCFGHSTGDQVLRRVAERLIHCLRPVDTVARYGGDEFVVLLAGLESTESARKAAGRLLCAIGDPFIVEGSSIRVSASIGIVPCGVRIEEPDEAIRLADRAMYRAKALGRRRYVVFDEQECPAFPVGRTAESSAANIEEER